MLRGQALPNPTHPNTGSWIKRLVVMISNPNDKVDSSDFGELMASCHNLTALHVVMHFPDASYHYPSSHVLFLNVLLTASTLQILNLVACVAPYKEDAIPSYFFKHMTALRAFRCDNNIVIPDIPPLDYLSVREWTVEDLLERDQTSVAIGEIFLQRVSLFPISLPKTKHLHRLNIHFSYALSIGNDDEEEEEARPEVDNSGLDLEDVPSPGEIPAASLEVDSIGSDSDAGGDGGGGHSHLGFSDSEDLQGAVDVLPPTVTYLSLLCGRWEHAVCRRLRRLPASVTTLGLEASREHATDTSYRHLVRMCRDLIAPGLTVVQLNHWQTCVDLRTRHPGLLKEFVEMLGNRNAELWDSEGYVMEGTVS